jgi:putative transposase
MAARRTFLQRVTASCEYEPRLVITDKPASYVTAVRRMVPHTERCRRNRLSNRAGNSHLPTRKRGRGFCNVGAG